VQFNPVNIAGALVVICHTPPHSTSLAGSVDHFLEELVKGTKILGEEILHLVARRSGTWSQIAEVEFMKNNAIELKVQATFVVKRAKRVITTGTSISHLLSESVEVVDVALTDV